MWIFFVNKYTWKRLFLMAVENVRGHKLQQRDCSRLLLKSGASRVGKERPPYPKLHSLWLALCPLLCESDECCWPRIPSSLNVTGPSMSTEAEAVLRLSNNWTITLVFWTDLTVDLHVVVIAASVAFIISHQGLLLRTQRSKRLLVFNVLSSSRK